MKSRFRLLALAVLMGLTMGSVSAQDYRAVTDTVWGNNCYIEYNGLPRGGSTSQKAMTSWPNSSSTTRLLYYVHLPAGNVKADLYMKTKASRTAPLKLVLTDPVTGDTIAAHADTATAKGAYNTVEMLPDVKIPTDGWYCMELTSSLGYTTVARVDYFLFKRTSVNKVTTSEIFMAPSVHLFTWNSTDPNAPSGQSYDWCYEEVYVPYEFEHVNSYYMTLGVLHGYMGVQSANYTNDSYKHYHNVLFSMWDNGDTDKDKNLPDYLRSGSLDKGPDVAINRFGGEGTGTQAMMSGGQFWHPGQWVQFITYCRPEEVHVTLKDDNGNDKVITYQNTICTAWYKMADWDEWYYIATHRLSGYNEYFSGWYSFVENWNNYAGDKYRRAYFRNGFMKSLGTGKWYSRNSVSYGHTQGTGSRNSRVDYGHGVTKDFANCFYLETGGYSSAVNDSANTHPLPTTSECVDTINLQALLNRVDKAIIKDKANEMTNVLAGNNTVSGLLAVCQDVLNKADQLGGYASADLGEVRQAYADGTGSDLNAMRTALRNLGQTAMPLKYSYVAKADHISSYRAYLLENASGYGFVQATEADGVASLQAVGSKHTDATEAAKATMKATDQNNNWTLVRDEVNSKYYLYNWGQAKYLDLSQGSMLNETPQEVTVTYNSSSQAFVIRQAGKYLCIAPASESGSITTATAMGKNTYFRLCDNNAMQPTLAQSDSLIQSIANFTALMNSISSVPKQIALAGNVVGAFKNQADKDQLAALYNNGNYTNSGLVQMIDLLANAERVSFDPQNKYYRIRSAASTNSAKPYLTVQTSGAVLNKAADNKADQVWEFIPQGKGYNVCSQGHAIEPVPADTKTAIAMGQISDANVNFLSDQGAYAFSIGAYDNAPYSITTGSTSALVAGNRTDGKAQWYLEEATDIKLSTNASGLFALYLACGVTLPEGLEAYTATAIQGDQIMMKKVDGSLIPAYSPVILKGEASTAYTLALTKTNDAPIASDILKGNAMAEGGHVAKSYLTLAIKSGLAAMYPCGYAVSPANTVYVNYTDETKDYEKLELNFTGATGVHGAQSTAQSEAEYNLKGQRVNADAKGIVVKGGKKVAK